MWSLNNKVQICNFNEWQLFCNHLTCCHFYYYSTIWVAITPCFDYVTTDSPYQWSHFCSLNIAFSINPAYFSARFRPLSYLFLSLLSYILHDQLWITLAVSLQSWFIIYLLWAMTECADICHSLEFNIKGLILDADVL